MSTVFQVPTAPACDEDPAPVLQAAGADVRVRFAPSPTGSLHVGGARTALFNYLAARNQGGKFVLRIEDTDEARSTRASEESMLADLRWLELDWDEGPDKPGEVGPYRQSERGEIYQRYARQLVDAGAAYPCFCTEEELEANRARAEAEGRPPQYDGTWRDADPAEVQRRMDAGEPFTYRFKVPKGKTVVIHDKVRGRVAWDAEATVGDFILLRSSGVPVYNFCVAVDDAAMGITHVVRAEEHLTNTLRQCLILDALGMPRPQYAHCSLILAEDRSKLSKRHGATSVDEFRRQGFTKEAMLNYLALLGWNAGTEQEIYSRQELFEKFSLDRVVKSAAVFDNAKLRWVNGQHLRALPAAEATPLVAAALREAGLAPARDDSPYVAAAVALAQPSLELLTDAAQIVGAVLGYPLAATAAAGEAEELLADDFRAVALALVAAGREGALPDPAAAEGFPEAWKAFLKGLGKRLGRKGKRLFHPVRLALTGQMSGADVGEQLRLLALAAREGVAHTPLEERLAALEKFALALPEPVPEAPAAEAAAAPAGAAVDAGRLAALETRVNKLAARLAAVEGKLGMAPAPAPAAKEAEMKKEAAPAKAEKAAPPPAAEKKEEAPKKPQHTGEQTELSRLEMRTGKILEISKHPEADKLYVEKIDLGEASGPRTIVSGLVEYLREDELLGKEVIVLANLKPRAMVGIESAGMLLCASDANDPNKVVPLAPPPGTPVGELVTFEGHAAEPMAAGNRASKAYGKVAPELHVDDEGRATFGGVPFMTSQGPVTASVKGPIS